MDTIKRQVKNLIQSNLQGEQIPAKDSEMFGHSYPTRINNNYSIITYQNTSQQPKYGNSYKSKETLRAFKNSRSSVAMYTEIGLNEKKLEMYDKFNDKMKKYSPKSKFYHNYNHHLSREESWNVPGGTVITLDENIHLHHVLDESGQDKKKLRRWTYTRVQGRDNVHTRFITAYRPCKN